MSTLRLIAKTLLLTTSFYPAVALAQTPEAEPAAEAPPTADAEAGAEVPADPPAEEPPVEISAPGADPSGGEIIVRGRRNIIRSTPEVLSVLSSEEIARTGEGEVAGALQRVTGLSVVGNGYVYVRGLGDRYSLALLNGLALPSPEPLKRVVPLDIFPTSILASAFVQKSYSVNYPGEFGGGVINLTTSSIPVDDFLSIGVSTGGDSETSLGLGYTHYGSPTDVLGFDSGERDIPGPLQAALNAGAPISEGAVFSRRDIQDITASLSNARTSVVQRNRDIPLNWGIDVNGGAAFDVGGVEVGVIASAGISNNWRTRDALQQTPGGDGISTEFRSVRTDSRVVTNGLLGIAGKFSGHEIRVTNLIIRDTLKTSRIAAGYDIQLADPIPGGPDQQINQRTAWYDRQLINSQLVGEFDFGDLEVDFRAGYANSRRDAPYERSFSYAFNEEANDYINTLTTNAQYANISFGELTEDVWNVGGDVTYALGDRLRVSVGGAYLDTHRESSRRDFNVRPANSINLAVAQQRPDYLLSDFNIYTYDIGLVETSALAGVAKYEGDLEVLGLYGQATIDITPELKFNTGVRYEDGQQSVTLVDLFNQGGLVQVAPLENEYWLPAATLTWSFRDNMQLRLHGSRTVARPQFRELAPQAYFDTDSDRQFFGNPFLGDSELTNAEARFEWYFGAQQRLSVAGFYKKIDNPIETITNVAGGGALITTFANAPTADLYGAEVEVQKYWPIPSLGTYRLVTIGNYAFSESRLKIRDGDVTILNDTRGERPASEVFTDGDPLTGQSRHLANLQLGIENTERLQQATFLVNYASKRVTSRGPILGETRQGDFIEDPGITVDFVARQGLTLLGKEAELSFKARNLLGEDYEEYQIVNDQRIEINRYKLGTSFSLGATLKF